jgi:hypothetical protein
VIVFHSLRRGAGSMRHTSRVPSPTAAGDTARRFTFAFQDSPRREGQAKRREAIAEYVEGWAGEAERVEDGCFKSVAGGANSSTPWGESLHPPASPRANRSSVWAILADSCANFPFGAFLEH